MRLGLNSPEQLDQHLLPLGGLKRFETRNKFLYIRHESILATLQALPR